MPQSSVYKLSCEDALAFVCDATWGLAEIDAGGRFIWLNRAYCEEILQAPIELIVGTHAIDVWTDPEDRAIELALAKQVAEGAIPGYTLAKRYRQRGSTPQKPRIIWGMQTVSGKWLETQEFSGYRVQFQPYTPQNAGLVKHLPSLNEIVKWTTTNWKTLVTIAAFVTSLTAASSVNLVESLNRAKKAADSVEQVLSPSQSGASPAQPSP